MEITTFKFQNYLRKSQNLKLENNIPSKKYKKNIKQISLYRHKDEPRKFGKEIKDYNNLTGIYNQSNTQISQINDILTRINKEKNKYKENGVRKFFRKKCLNNKSNEIENNENLNKTNIIYCIENKNPFFKKLKLSKEHRKKIPTLSVNTTKNINNNDSLLTGDNNDYSYRSKNYNTFKARNFSLIMRNIGNINKSNCSYKHKNESKNNIKKIQAIEMNVKTNRNESYLSRFIKKHYNINNAPPQNLKLINLSINEIETNLKDEQKNISNYTNNFETYNKNPQVPKEYIEDILLHLKSIENNNLPLKNYMTSKQTDINEHMRNILLDWLVEIHLKFNLLNETLHITINIIDKFLSKININRKYLQLLGITALLIACKYEEIYYPPIKELINMTDNAYQLNEVLKMEHKILEILNFEVCFPTSQRFFEFFAEKLNLTEKEYFRCLYFIEICLIDYNFCSCKPSLIAAVCLYVNLKNMDCSYSEQKFYEVCGYRETDLVFYSNIFNEGISKIENPGYKYNAIKRKFRLTKYMCVADGVNINNNNIKMEIKEKSSN